MSVTSSRLSSSAWRENTGLCVMAAGRADGGGGTHLLHAPVHGQCFVRLGQHPLPSLGE